MIPFLLPHHSRPLCFPLSLIFYAPVAAGRGNLHSGRLVHIGVVAAAETAPGAELEI